MQRYKRCQTVRPALERFYNSLSDEQKERFNELGPKNTAANAEASEASQAADACKQPKQGLANLPIEKIEDAVNPTDAQGVGVEQTAGRDQQGGLDHAGGLPG